MKVEVIVRCISDTAIVPRKINNLATGFDLFSPSDNEIAPNTQICISLGISLHFPIG